MTPETMAFYSGAASGILSLIFNWTPRLRQRFDLLTADQQRLSMAVMTFIIAVVINLYQCFSQETVCSRRSILEHIGIFAATFLAGAVTNQGVNDLTPKPKEVRVRRKKRIGSKT